MTRTKSSPAVVRASELGEYVYCARAWWLRRVQGVPSLNTTALQSGQHAHDRHGNAVAAAQRQRRWAGLLLALAIVLLLIALLGALGGQL